MESFKSILIEDLQVYKKSLEIEEYSFCNVISNRLITNAVILSSKEFTLIGAILKEILNYVTMIEEQKEIKKKIEKLLDDFLNNDNISIDTILNSYSNAIYDIFIIINPDYEIYNENIEYSLFSTKYFINFFKKELEKQEIAYQIDLIYHGIANELNRIYRNFGYNTHQLLLKILITFSGRLYDYYRYIIYSEKSEKKIWESRYLKIKNQIKQNVSSFDLNDEYINNTSDLLFKICKKWRHMFIRVMDIVSPIKKQKTSIPPNIQNELKDMVSKVTNSKLQGD